MNHIFYIMGKSSSGKDRLYSRLLPELGLLPLVIYTTRPIRKNEKDGREYHFVDRERFREMAESGRVIEERTYKTVAGDWTYFTAKDSIDLGAGSYLGIGTPESYGKLREYFGAEAVVPIYVEVADDIRLIRAIEREKKQKVPAYTELCRRFIADSDDFSEEKLKAAGIDVRFDNSLDFETCFACIKRYISDLLQDRG